jgi:hypothetical protein
MQTAPKIETKAQRHLKALLDDHGSKMRTSLLRFTIVGN